MPACVTLTPGDNKITTSALLRPIPSLFTVSMLLGLFRIAFTINILKYLVADGACEVLLSIKKTSGRGDGIRGSLIFVKSRTPSFTCHLLPKPIKIFVIRRSVVTGV